MHFPRLWAIFVPKERSKHSFVPTARECRSRQSVTDMSCGDSELSQSVVSRPHRGGGQWRSCGSGHSGEQSRSPPVCGLKGRQLPVHVRKSFSLSIKGRWAGVHDAYDCHSRILNNESEVSPNNLIFRVCYIAKFAC